MSKFQLFVTVALAAALSQGCRGQVGAVTECKVNPASGAEECKTSHARYSFLTPDGGLGVQSSSIAGGVLYDYVEMGGASAIVIDTSGSNIGLPPSAPVTLTLLDAFGQPLATTQFVATRNGSVFVPSNVSAVDAWMHANAGAAADFDVVFGPLPVTSSPGWNQYSVEIAIQGLTVASSGQEWTRPCPPGQVCRHEP